MLLQVDTSFRFFGERAAAAFSRRRQNRAARLSGPSSSWVASIGDTDFHPFAQGPQFIGAELFGQGEHLLLFLVGVVFDELGQHRHLGFETLVPGIDLGELLQDELHDVMLLERLRDHLLGLRGLEAADGRVEDLFLNPRVHRERLADLLHQASAAAGVAGLLHFLEHRLHFTMLLLQQIRRFHSVVPPTDN
ncbi:MAG TPA: hypothetical protein VK548_22070 [Candidatus Acidoferrum sp.]|nr:hypothetical protein [Candidatus Acidoferrum sp.]